MNTFKYQKIRYDINCRNNGINCWGLYRKVIKEELDIDVPMFFPLINTRVGIADEFEKQINSENNHHEKIDSPTDYCLVIFKYKHASKHCYHCGIYYKGRVLHANGSGNMGGVWYDKIRDIKHDSIEYFKHESI